MKRFFTLAALALVLGAGQADAQNLRKTWDFREGFSAKTVNALKGDQEEFGDTKYWRNYESDATKADEAHYWNASGDFKNSDGYACTHNGGNEKVIPELEGLKLGATAAKKFVITYNGTMKTDEEKYADAPEHRHPFGPSYIWLNGKNETFSFQAEVNQTIKIGVESHSDSQDRGISLTASTGSLTLTAGNPVPTHYTECEWELTGTDGEVATMTVKTTNGCHIYYIIVGEGDDPNANKTKVGYLTSGDATSEAAYQTIAADESYNVTALDAATVTAEQLQDYHVTVVSPELSADNAAVEVLRQAMPFVPIVNLNADLYAAWGYGEAYESGMSMALITNIKHELFAGLVADEDYIAHEVEGQYIVDLGVESFKGIRLGDYFAGDAVPAIDGSDETVAAIHAHNPYHNAYIYVPFGTSAAAQKIFFNALEMAKGSKSAIEQAPAPKITLEYKNLNTNIILSMASSSLPKPQIFYTLDGTEPTAASTLYTDVINVTAETTVKAVAIAEGYLLSDVAEAKAEIFTQPAMPVVGKDYQDGKTMVSLSCETEGVDLWYNFTEGNDTTKSMKYTEPFAITLPTNLTAFAVAGGQVFSEIVSDRIVVKDVVVRQDQIGVFDANADEWQNGGGSTVYYFSWGKSATTIYDSTQEPTVEVDPATGDEISTYPERDYEYYVPSEEATWEVKSKGQVMIYQVLTIGKDPGNDSGYNPETAGDLLSYASPSSNDIQFGGKTSGEPCTGAIQSRVKWAGPFDVVTIVGTAAGGDNVGRMQIQVSKDSVNWENLGDEMATSTVKRLWKSYTRSYNEADEVYVRIIQAGGGSSVQIYNMFILNEGEKSAELKAQYDAEYQEAIQNGISDVNVAAKVLEGVYNLNGMRIKGMQRGLNIVVRQDGTVRKVLVK